MDIEGCDGSFEPLPRTPESRAWCSSLPQHCPYCRHRLGLSYAIFNSRPGSLRLAHCCKQIQYRRRRQRAPRQTAARRVFLRVPTPSLLGPVRHCKPRDYPCPCKHSTPIWARHRHRSLRNTNAGVKDERLRRGLSRMRPFLSRCSTRSCRLAKLAEILFRFNLGASPTFWGPGPSL